MPDRLHQIIEEIKQKCDEANCSEFEYHWEIWGVLWYPWFLKINGKSPSFSFNDLSDDDLRKLCAEGFIELVKEYSNDEKSAYEFDKKRYRLISSRS
ncbi:MAG: hypothetical protein ACFB0B_09040 [Thermonemataceae bacterium]